MSIDDATLSAIEQLRTQLTAINDAHTRTMTKAWVEAWDTVAADLDGALQQLADEAGEGRITRKAVMRSERLRKALDAIRSSLADLFDQSGQIIIEQLDDVVTQAGLTQETLIAGQLPEDERAAVKQWSRVDSRQIGAIVTRSTEQITKLSFPLSDEATATMRRELVRGLAGGKNPRDVAAKMIKRTEGLFNGGLPRALTIARTEMLDAHRTAAALADAENADILEGWIWTASLSARTCPACWGMHGTLFPITQAGPEGHQNCRCVRVPKTKTWAELGFEGLDEPVSLMPDAATVFDGLPAGTQRDILGPRRHDAWKNGDYPIDSWATKRTNDSWRDSWVPSKAPAAA
jgi:SPP1 gp7 family putative phage head morphogenesis protein